MVIADNGVANAQTYGDRFRIPMVCSDEGSVYKNRIVVVDTDGVKQIKLAGAGDIQIAGITSENMGGYSNGNDGSATKPYTDGDNVTVTVLGVEMLDVLITDDQDAGYIDDGDYIVAGAGGKAVKWVAESDLGDSATGAEIMAYIKSHAGTCIKAIGAPDANGQVAAFIYRLG